MASCPLRRLPSALCVGLLICSFACAQDIATTLDYTWDQPTGQFYAYAQAGLDYDAAYYYSACVWMDLYEYATASWQTTTITCSDSGDADLEWDTSVSTILPDTIDLESDNQVYLDYYADQFGDGYPDGYYFDAYNASYFAGSIDESGGADYLLPGPAEGVQQQELNYYEYAEVVTCDYTVGPTAFHAPSCGKASDAEPFSINLMPSNQACGGKINNSASTCPVTVVSGEVDLDIAGHPPNGYTCTFVGLGGSGTAYLFGPSSSSSTGNVDVAFSVVFNGQGTVNHDTVAQVLCP